MERSNFDVTEFQGKQEFHCGDRPTDRTTDEESYRDAMLAILNFDLKNGKYTPFGHLKRLYFQNRLSVRVEILHEVLKELVLSLDVNASGTKRYPVKILSPNKQN